MGWLVGFGTLVFALAVGDGRAAAEPLRVMSFNIRYGTAADGEHAWPKRRDLVYELLRSEGPQVIGVQEALRFQLDEIREALPQYKEVGVGRDDGREAGEYAAILYDGGRIEMLDSGTYWFCDSPETPGTPTWGSTFPRVCTWMRARDKVSVREFYVFNVHWDHQSQESREKSAAMLLERIADIVPKNTPLIVTGDFNANEENAAFRRLVADDAPVTEDAPLRDSFRAVQPNATDVGTFHGFTGQSDSGKIDAVLVSPEWEVEAAEIVRTHRDELFPSDHYPVTAVLELPAAE